MGVKMDLGQPPLGVTETAWAGQDADRLRVGDLWLLSWDQEAVGLAVVSGIASTFAIVWPVSLPQDPIFPPAMSIPESPLGVPLAVWPTRETGVGSHLFHRRYGALLTDRAMASTEAYLAGEAEETPFAFAEPNVDVGDYEAASDELIDRWEAICLNTWPESELGASPLSREALMRAGVDVERLAAMTSTSAPEAVAMFRGEVIPSAGTISQLAHELGIEPEELIESSGFGRVLASPQFKDELVNAARALSIGELELRDLVRTDLALAARSDGDTAARVRAVIDRVVAAGQQ